ncbi:MAG: metallophosphoesterase family protein [Candidatus Njordarchaeia archaeon]
MESMLQILAFGDIHGEIEKLIRVLDHAFDRYDVDMILVAGDLNLGFSEIEDVFTRNKIPTFIIYGNHDDDLKPIYELRAYRYKNISFLRLGGVIRYKGANILGIPGNRGGGRKWTHWQDYKIKRIIEYQKDKKIDIVLSHEAPFGYSDECGDHNRCGKPVLLDLIKVLRPRLFICGHLHNHIQISEFERTKIINTGAISNRWGEDSEYVYIRLNGEIVIEPHVLKE